MNKLFPHIEYLLLRHDCVIVPGLGAFIANMKPARIDMEQGKIIPPRKELMFNQAVRIDDGLLASSYSRKYCISFQEARQVLARNVNSMLEEIHSKGILKCGTLGSLVLGEERRLQFVPGQQFSGKDNVWMPELDILAVKNENDGEIADHSASESEYSEEVQDTTDRYYNFRISKVFTKISAACVLVMALTLAFLFNPIPADEREQRASVVPVEAFIPSRSTEEPQIETTDMQAAEDTVSVAEKPAHYLIVATFSSNAEASKFVDKYSTDDYPMETVDSRKLSRVSIASSDDKEALREKLNSRDINTRFPGAWIWSRN